MNLICQTCYKSQSVLEALGKLRYVQGYAQCSDCHSDLEYESAVIRQIHYDKHRENGTPYPKWLHNELDKKGFLRKVDMSKYISKEEEATIRKVAKDFQEEGLLD